MNMKINRISFVRNFITISFFAVLIFFLFSCNDFFNKEKALNDVIAKYPNAKIYRYEKQKSDFIFYVVDSNSLKIVRCQSFKNPYISSVEELKRIK